MGRVSVVTENLSVTRWIQELKEGDADAARHLWETYFHQLLAVAHQRLGPSARRVADEEDLALSVFDSLFRGAAEGQFPQLANRADFWHLLVAITTNKAIDHLRAANRQKRGEGHVRGDSVFGTDAIAWHRGFDALAAHDLAPDLITLFDEEYQRLLSLLRDDTLRHIVAWKLEGHNNLEIAQRLNISHYAVSRKIRLIRMKWSEELTS